MITRAALYARVSTLDQDPELQLRELRQAASQRGWKVVGEHVDHGVSGTRMRRPALDRLRADVAAGRVNLVAVWKLDRLGRSVIDLLHLVHEITAGGAAFVSLRDAGIDTSTPTGQMLLTILAAFAAFERDLIRERTMAGQAAARAAGKHVGRPRTKLTREQAESAVRSFGGVRAAARGLGVALGTLSRRLAEKAR